MEPLLVQCASAAIKSKSIIIINTFMMLRSQKDYYCYCPTKDIVVVMFTLFDKLKINPSFI